MSNVRTIRELAKNVSTIIENVRTSKESVIVTKNGKPCAKIVFYDGTETPLEAQGSTIVGELSPEAIEVAKKPQVERLAIARASILEYGCGCKKEDKNPLCPRHGRY
jgi:prevent-host-death family protein